MKEKRSLYEVIFGSKKTIGTQTDLKMLNGYNSVFTPVDRNIYNTKVAREVIDRIATHCAKLVPKHIQEGKGHIYGDINYLLEYEPNPIMTKYDFMYKMISQLYNNSNAFVYIQKDSKNNILGFYPVLDHDYKLLEDKSKRIYLRFKFVNGQVYTILYTNLIHLRKFYNENDIFGTDSGILTTDLQAVHTASEGTKNAIQTTSNLKGILKFTNAMLKEEDIKASQEQFVKDFVSMKNKSGIAALDGKADFKELNLNPTILDKDQLKQLNTNIFDYFGVSESIVNNSFTDDEWNAFYEGVIEPLAIQLGDEFTRKIFSKQAIRNGNRIVFTANRLQYASLSTKIKLIHELAPYGMLRVDEGREIIDLAPIGGDMGNRILQSLNNINSELADEYQGGNNEGN